jgi:hypothetical protein
MLGEWLSHLKWTLNLLFSTYTNLNFVRDKEGGLQEVCGVLNLEPLPRGLMLISPRTPGGYKFIVWLSELYFVLV